MSSHSGKIRQAFACAFPYTVPIFAGFWFLGLTYGIYMNVSGFPFWYPMVMSLTIFAGSVEFVAVDMLQGAFNPIQALTLTLMIRLTSALGAEQRRSFLICSKLLQSILKNGFLI